MTPTPIPSPTKPLDARLIEGLQALGLPLDEAQRTQLWRYLDLIAQWNKVYNLTAVREPAAMLSQHLLDCLAIVQPLRQRLAAMDGQGGRSVRRLLDVGSGAGLPGVVLAVCNPDWDVMCVDAVAKKAGFIRQVAAELHLPNLRATHQRVETMSGVPFELIVSRAFSSLADFVRLTAEQLSQGGAWAAMKANVSGEELAAVPPDVTVFHVEPLKVPTLDAARCLVWMRRTAD
jgi:16S rRNA (guanine527-N7)-methyltransferase